MNVFIALKGTHFWFLLFMFQWFLVNILYTFWWMTVVILKLGIMDQCTHKIDLIKYVWVSDQHFMVQWFFPSICKTIWWRNIILRIMAKCDTKIGLINYMWQQCLLLSAGPAIKTRQNSLTGPATFSGVKLDSNSSWNREKWQPGREEWWRTITTFFIQFK